MSTMRRPMKKLVLVSFLVVCCQLGVVGATWYTASGGDISGNIWATTTNGTPGAISPGLVDGDILYIDDNIRCDFNFNTWGNINLTIYLNATLTFGSGGQLHLGDASTIVFQSSSGKVVAEGGGSSNKINFGGGGSEWDGSDGDLTGPGTLDTNSNGALPVLLSDFSAEVTGLGVTLNWMTTLEENFREFVVERALNGINYVSIGSVRAAGRNLASVETNYSFDDLFAVSGNSYYRLKAVDLDDNFEYFGPVVAKYGAQRAVSVFPNPSIGNEISFVTNFAPSEKDRVIVRDQLGVVLINSSILEVKSSLIFKSQLKAGVYYLQYISPGFESTSRIFVK